ncbi:hypothetical protein WN48_05490 [Eufriesea mexicana]|uniref:Uncharacterized protein n=1 Tax=Eufriesea mexicana TaxID=516756 RepID=A0A310SDP5_9HYME|nr:hypothetical protein WN48_05490 [Eufriesea mexicana]
MVNLMSQVSNPSSSLKQESCAIYDIISMADISESSVIALSRVRKIETSVITSHLLLCTLLGTRGNSFTKLWHVNDQGTSTTEKLD